MESRVIYAYEIPGLVGVLLIAWGSYIPPKFEIGLINSATR